MSGQRCAEEVARGDWDYGPCQNPATKLEEGKWWCAIHAPSKKKAREARMDAKWAWERTVLNRQALESSAIEALRRVYGQFRLDMANDLIARDDKLTKEVEEAKKKLKELEK